MANQRRPGIASGASGEIGDISVVGQLIGAGPAHGFGWPRLGNRLAALWGNSATSSGAQPAAEPRASGGKGPLARLRLATVSHTPPARRPQGHRVASLIAHFLASSPRKWGRLRGWVAPRIGAVEAGALAKAAEDYCAELRRIGPEALLVTDKTPRNFELLWMLRLAFPDARVIHCRRRPVDTCLSIFFKNFSARQGYACDRGDLVFFYRQYERLMDHWRRALPADRFTEVEYETLVADREAETRRLIAFCGLNWDDACLAPERNSRVVKTPSLWQVRQPVYNTSVERWRRYEPWLGELRELLPAAEAEGS